MSSRAIIHVTGPVRSGKTGFVEAVLSSSRWLWTLATRCTMDSMLERPVESSPARHPELDRYRAARACLRRVSFPPGDLRIRLLRDPTDGELFGVGRHRGGLSCPVSYADLGVFVAPPLPPGRSLLTRPAGGGWQSRPARRASPEGRHGAPDGRTDGGRLSGKAARQAVDDRGAVPGHPGRRLSS